MKWASLRAKKHTKDYVIAHWLATKSGGCPSEMYILKVKARGVKEYSIWLWNAKEKRQEAGPFPDLKTARIAYMLMAGSVADET